MPSFRPFIRLQLRLTTRLIASSTFLSLQNLLYHLRMTTRGSRGEGGRRGRGGGPDLVKTISKALSSTLRHNAAKEGLILRPDGYANVGELLAMPKFRKLDLTLDKLRQVVKDNDKQRFTLASASAVLTPDVVVLPAATAVEAEDPSTYLIRANQGHSIPLSNESLNLIPLDPSTNPSAVHGTFYSSYEAILASGFLSRMARNHIHLATAETGVVSGMRRDAEVLVVVDVRRAVEAGGLKFWMSANGVVLTEGDGEGTLALEFVERIVDKGGLAGGGILWEAGKVVRELPAELRGRRPPRGKGGVGRNRGRGEGRARGGVWRGREPSLVGTDVLEAVIP